MITPMNALHKLKWSADGTGTMLSGETYFDIVWMAQFIAKFDGLLVHGMTYGAMTASHIANFDNKLQCNFDDKHTGFEPRTTSIHGDTLLVYVSDAEPTADP